MNTKIITLKTNYNHKLGCDWFLHIDVAPTEAIPESRLQDTIIEIRTADKSHLPVQAKLEDLARVPLGYITSVVTYPSHGMASGEFIAWIQEQNPKITIASIVAIYFYKKIA